MRRGIEWFIASLAIVIAAIAGASCSAAGNGTSGDLGDGGHGAGHSSGIAAGGGSANGGAFGSSANAGGSTGSGPPPPTNCDSSCQTAGGTCNHGVCEISENPGNVDQGTQMQLQGGGKADTTFRWVYPYDQTVFPRGLLSPSLQFESAGAATAFYVHVSFAGMDYKGFYGPAAAPCGTLPSACERVKLSDAVWTALTSTARAIDTVQVEVTQIAGGAVSGPVSESWSIAQGSMRGTIYYETYGSQLAGAVGIMKILPGAKTPTVVKTGCGHVCHTASADGSTLVSATSLMGSASWDLKNNASLIANGSKNRFTYGGIYPDGSFAISATNYRTWTPFLGGDSILYDTKTGDPIAAPSWTGAVKHAGTVSFSPDGKWVAFNHEDTGHGHSLAAMQYDHPSNTFSNLQDIAEDSQATLAWPAFTPDSKGVAFHAGSDAQFETDKDATGDVFFVDLASKKTVRLDALDGYSSATQNYLPANDPGLSFAPTILPEAVGGYFWVVFTSHRSYGNTLPSKDNGDQNGKIWVAALDLNPTPGKDGSHPAFYLDGQEPGADNLRGFWVLDPCEADGSACVSGDQCCGGFCNDGTCGSMSTMGCSAEYEKCSTAGDCCNKADLCINDRCALPAPH